MIRVTESEWERGDRPKSHTYPTAQVFSVQPNGALLVYELDDNGHPKQHPVAAFADGAWDTVVTDLADAVPTEQGPPMAQGPTESSDQSTTGPSTFDQAPDVGPLMNDAADIPGGSPSDEAVSGETDSVMTQAVFAGRPDITRDPVSTGVDDAVEAGVVTDIRRDVPISNEVEESIPPQATAPAGQDVDPDTKVVQDGQGNPVVMKRNPDNTWRTVSPDEVIPEAVRPALIDRP